MAASLIAARAAELQLGVARCNRGESVAQLRQTLKPLPSLSSLRPQLPARTFVFHSEIAKKRCGNPGVRAAEGNGAANGAGNGKPKIATLKDGKAVDGPDLSVKVNGITFPNPFVIGSGPPGTNYQVMKKAFDEGWGGVICKTLSLDSSKVINVTPRYAKLKAQGGKEVIGWQNIELISDRPFETMLAELKQLKEEYPDRVLIASIMEEYNRGAWEEIIERCESVGVDAFEINFSCPHGMPERKMGAAMGQDPELLTEVCGWINAKATVPVWAKMTPNITDITVPSRAALAQGCEGVAAINTIMSVMGINLKTLAPEPCVEGYSTPGGYSSKAVRPIALARCMNISKMIERDFPGQGKTLSGIGGVETGENAAEFILLGASTVQVCTGVMLHGYPLVKELCGGLQEFMKQHNFSSIEQFRGHSLQYFTTHTDLVRRQKEAIAAKKAARVGLANDKDWTGEGFVKETESMVSNS
ncbi:Dihydropyrimidine dehydrogenase [Klebsormidium nitens]|uniref:dihydropyrimidine dehydrogenase (NADP(+)) n=1 Tax=Klebsormidium nitens TaxID=105231 RepID=A0A0U9HQY1_KLENI|nr:Dihydropyrimidine dehydrogenase [Klebsormidium nitens]|eukprot:GAQ80240.1 Dihydropyrimidine dehydrogenase [Klebsormidium nitens]